MIDINGIIEKNKEYVAKHPELAQKGLTSHPTKKLAIVTCMDTRLVGMLEESLGFDRGEVITIKTAGNSVTQPIDNIVQSLLVSTYGMGIEDVIVIGHENCGMIDFSAEQFMESMKAKGINEDAIRMIEPGLVRYTVKFLRHHPLFPRGMGFYGGMMDPDTGEFRYIEV
ncbi:MAG: carbonic anhydrase [Veillonella sp.]|nr:carbonic anhydrase [Veillonella sp.]